MQRQEIPLAEARIVGLAGQAKDAARLYGLDCQALDGVAARHTLGQRAGPLALQLETLLLGFGADEGAEAGEERMCQMMSV